MADASLMVKLWKLLIEMYGHKFVSAYGEVPNETWALALASFEWHELSAGVRACFRRDETWPPTLPEFIKLCRPEQMRPNRPPETGASIRLLPKPPAERKAVHALLAEVKKFLR